MAAELISLKPGQHHVTFVPKFTTDLPFFNLTLHKKDARKIIRYRGIDLDGRPIQWDVFPNMSAEIGPPAVEAHRAWVLLVKPSIDASKTPERKIPTIIALGGVRECLRKVGWTIGGRQARELIRALTQISFAGCVADFWIRTRQVDAEGKERYFHVNGRFSRMSVYAIGEHHLTEEELSTANFGFDLEDIIYIRLDPLEVVLQESQDQRLLDNAYLFSVKPAGRRWYELMAPKIFGVIKNKGKYCEVRYSWYVKHHHTLKRYYQRYRVVQQMNRVVRDHRESSYLDGVEYHAVKEPGQEPDFIIRYYPGPAARASIARIRSHLQRSRSSEPTMDGDGSGQGSGNTDLFIATPASQGSDLTEDQKRIAKRLMDEFGVTGAKASELVRSKLEQAKSQLAAWPFRDVKAGNLAGWIIDAIENEYALPEAYLESRQREEAEQQLDKYRAAIAGCAFCGDNGYRYVGERTVRKCSHDPVIESQHSGREN